MIYNFNIAQMSTQARPIACLKNRFELRKVWNTSKIPDVQTHFIKLTMEGLSDELSIHPVEAPLNFMPRFLNDKNYATFAFSLMPFGSFDPKKGKKMAEMLKEE